MKNKLNINKGISLIVLVVTIIIMIIIAGAIIVSLNQTNVINEAEDATAKSNLKAVEEAAELEYMHLMEESETGEVEMTDAELQSHLKQILHAQGLDGNLISVVDQEIIIAGLDDKYATTNDDFIFTIGTSTANQTVAFPIFYDGEDDENANDFVIDFGDGSPTEHITEVAKRALNDQGRNDVINLVIHTYMEPATHTITITGKCKYIDQTEFYERYINDHTADHPERESGMAEILSIVQWGNTQLEIFESDTVIGELPSPKSTSFDNLVYLDLGQSPISKIPHNLLYGCTKLEYASFNYTNITEIPETLYRDCVNLEEFSFSNTRISSIPENLFENCNKIKDCMYAFSHCSSVRGTVPDLWNKPSITNGLGCYGGVPSTVTNYLEIPAEWLDNSNDK